MMWALLAVALLIAGALLYYRHKPVKSQPVGIVQPVIGRQAYRTLPVLRCRAVRRGWRNRIPAHRKHFKSRLHK